MVCLEVGEQSLSERVACLACLCILQVQPRKMQAGSLSASCASSRAEHWCSMGHKQQRREDSQAVEP